MLRITPHSTGGTADITTPANKLRPTMPAEARDFGEKDE
jgi:hypothetical protein